MYPDSAAVRYARSSAIKPATTETNDESLI